MSHIQSFSMMDSVKGLQQGHCPMRPDLHERITHPRLQVRMHRQWSSGGAASLKHTSVQVWSQQHFRRVQRNAWLALGLLILLPAATLCRWDHVQPQECLHRPETATGKVHDHPLSINPGRTVVRVHNCYWATHLKVPSPGLREL
jgi:hypothetical protein